MEDRAYTEAANKSSAFAWTLEQAVELCKKIEPVLARFGCHTALTGGVLYKSGERKDCDVIIYREGMEFGKERGPFNETVDRVAMLKALADDIDLVSYLEHVRVVKCYYGESCKAVDLIFPELDGEYKPPVEEVVS